MSFPVSIQEQDCHLYFVENGSRAAAELRDFAPAVSDPVLFCGPGSLDPVFLSAATAQLTFPWGLRFPSMGSKFDGTTASRCAMINALEDTDDALNRSAGGLTEPHDLLTLVAHGGGGHMTIGPVQLCATADIYPDLTGCTRWPDGRITCRRPRSGVRATLSPRDLAARRLILVGCSLFVPSERPIIGDMSLALAAGLSGTEELLISQALLPMPSEAAEEAHRLAEAGVSLLDIAAHLNRSYWTRFQVRPFLAFARTIERTDPAPLDSVSPALSVPVEPGEDLKTTQEASASAEWFGVVASQIADVPAALPRLVHEHQKLSMEAARLATYRARGGRPPAAALRVFNLLPVVQNAWGQAALSAIHADTLGHALLEAFFGSVDWQSRTPGTACPSCGGDTVHMSGPAFLFDRAGTLEGRRCWICGVLELAFVNGPRVQIDVTPRPGAASVRLTGDGTDGFVFCVRDKTNEKLVATQCTNEPAHTADVALPADVHECFAFGVAGMRFAFAFRHVVPLPAEPQ